MTGGFDTWEHESAGDDLPAHLLGEGQPAGHEALDGFLVGRQGGHEMLSDALRDVHLVPVALLAGEGEPAGLIPKLLPYVAVVGHNDVGRGLGPQGLVHEATQPQTFVGTQTAPKVSGSSWAMPNGS